MTDKIYVCPECGEQWEGSNSECAACGSCVNPILYDKKQWEKEMEESYQLALKNGWI